jgi:hypothetical protein
VKRSTQQALQKIPTTSDADAVGRRNLLNTLEDRHQDAASPDVPSLRTGMIGLLYNWLLIVKNFASSFVADDLDATLCERVSQPLAERVGFGPNSIFWIL